MHLVVRCDDHTTDIDERSIGRASTRGGRDRKQATFSTSSFTFITEAAEKAGGAGDEGKGDVNSRDPCQSRRSPHPRSPSIVG